VIGYDQPDVYLTLRSIQALRFAKKDASRDRISTGSDVSGSRLSPVFRPEIPSRPA